MAMLSRATTGRKANSIPPVRACAGRAPACSGAPGATGTGSTPSATFDRSSIRFAQFEQDALITGAREIVALEGAERTSLLP
ncbi:hypothetical protein LP420_14545 [Massilia sp. B-10]|nr:hypothetical protein LP420_14545 [Massilia sp. B-10]